MKTKFTTTLDSYIIKLIKTIAVKRGIGANDIITDAFLFYMDSKYSSDDITSLKQEVSSCG